MPRRAISLVLRRSILALLGLAVFGCGLSDYEARMDATHAYLARYDEENKILGEVIDQPTEIVRKTETRDVWPFMVLLRLPRGVSGTLDEKARLSRAFPLYVFAGSDSYVYVAAGVAVDKTDPKTGALSPEDFRKASLVAISNGYSFYGLNAHNGSLYTQPQVGAPQKVTKQPQPLRETTTPPLPLTFEALTFQGEMKANSVKYQFQLYQLRQGDRQAVVIYQIPLDRAGGDTQKAIDMSLKSLDISDRAVVRRAEMLQMIQRRRAK